MVPPCPESARAPGVNRSRHSLAIVERRARSVPAPVQECGQNIWPGVHPCLAVSGCLHPLTRWSQQGRISSVPHHGSEGSPPGNRDQPDADPIEPNPALRLGLQKFGVDCWGENYTRVHATPATAHTAETMRATPLTSRPKGQAPTPRARSGHRGGPRVSRTPRYSSD